MSAPTRECEPVVSVENCYPLEEPPPRSDMCGYIRIEATTDSNLFITNSVVPYESTGVRLFVSTYTIFMAATFILTYFFCLFYWHIPYCLGFLIACQLFFQLILLFYSDFFCQLAYTLSWRCPGVSNTHSCFCSVCDWILIFSYFVSWTAAVVVLAPLFHTFRQITVFPPLKNSYVNTLPFASLEEVSFIYFNPSVTANFDIINAQLLPTTGRSRSSVEFVDHLSMRSLLNYSSSQGEFVLNSTLLALQPNETTPSTLLSIPNLKRLPQSIRNFFSQYWSPVFLFSNINILKESYTSLSQFNVQKKGFKPSRTYAYRLWPNLWIGSTPDATVAAVLLQDPQPFIKKNLLNESPLNQTYVWAVCSDAATIGCECFGLSAHRVTNPVRCETNGLCGFQMPNAMASRNGVNFLVQETKRRFNLSMDTRNIFICLEKPDILEKVIFTDIQWGCIFGLPFLFVFTIVSCRLLIFYIFQAP